MENHFNIFGVEFQKIRKMYDSGEFTDYVVYKSRPKVVRNLLLEGCDVDILNIASRIRSLKLMISSNTLPIVAYCPSAIPEEIISELSNVAVNGEHLLSKESRFEKWIVSEAERGNILLKDGKLCTENPIWERLQSSKSLVVQKNPFSFSKKTIVTSENLLPVYKSMGKLSEKSRNNILSFNSMFFTMEITDMRNCYTYFGQPYGLSVNNEKVITPALFKRGTFFINHDGSSEARVISIDDMNFKVGGVKLVISDNCEVWRRPKTIRTGKSTGIVDMVVVNDRVISWKENGDVEIPDAGFVIRVDKKTFSKMKDFDIAYDDLDNVSFAVQGGPILVKEGIPRDGFCDEEFGGKIDYPPTVFPFDWDKTPAARIAIGYDKEKMIVVAVEGCNRYPYRPDFDSRGFTLSELTQVMIENRARNAINLDGGGSTQVRFWGGKTLKYADRMGIPYHEFERPIPAAVFIQN